MNAHQNLHRSKKRKVSSVKYALGKARANERCPYAVASACIRGPGQLSPTLAVMRLTSTVG
jgi:hypothetical protein